MVNATSRPLYPQERPDTHCIGGWVGPRAGLYGCGKSHPPTGIRSPDRPVRGESLYRLSYRGPQQLLLLTLNLCLQQSCKKNLHLPSTAWRTRRQDTTVYNKFTCSFTHNYFMYISLMMIPYRSKHVEIYYFNTKNSYN